MALTGKIAEEMIRESEKAGRVLMAAQVLRFFPSYRSLIESVHGGSLGPVRSAVFRRRCAAPVWSTWLADPARSGGGIFDLLIHDADICVHLFGLPKSISASGYEDLPNGIDAITAALHYPDVPSVVITGGWHHKKSYPFSMEYTVSMHGGTLEYSSANGATTLYDAQGESKPVAMPDKDGFAAELQYFVDCCRTGARPVLCPPEESADAVKLTAWMRDARKNHGEKIECP
jgi:predicted dehydrogenase